MGWVYGVIYFVDRERHIHWCENCDTMVTPYLCMTPEPPQGLRFHQHTTPITLPGTITHIPPDSKHVLSASYLANSALWNSISRAAGTSATHHSNVIHLSQVCHTSTTPTRGGIFIGHTQLPHFIPTRRASSRECRQQEVIYFNVWYLEYRRWLIFGMGKYC